MIKYSVFQKNENFVCDNWIIIFTNLTELFIERKIPDPWKVL